ncbi:cyclic di-GMP phosphodiesterase response regulator RpfG [Clostridium homopropionicum DSM 5847]|uniref:Cyclic di-GMP phosphodiesterase response regulator RpfG n=1 Tax=Clostridium homopropionicum DSM 5847 TaxID=1121318 RepID=A0A0L6ZBT2_9CLOT|nr:HD domain-containing phosphohydrolase [Clostridium homopropionicum]KOA20417.1 cyclic di-GMP phosphodiesterase response regulator RpfG [Clostridium homopropionicum DSM 5847]SFG34227.1 diguanylate cyclase (GGDEF) domain-containing protein [Clostridium homopropionicum]
MKRNFSLKHQMLASNILIFVLPALVFGYVTISTFYKRTKEEIKLNNITTTTHVNNQIENFIQGPINVMNEVREVLFKREFIEENEVNTYLNSIRNIYSYFDSIRIINKEGRVKNIAPYSEEQIGTSMIYEDFFKEIDITGKSMWSRVYLSNQTHKPTVNISMYINGDVVVGSLNLSKLTEIIQGIPVEKEWSISLLDENGIYIFDKRNGENVSQRRIFDYFSDIKEGIKQNNAMINVNSSGELMLYSTKIKSTGWYSVIVVESEKIFKPVDRFRNAFYVGLIIFLILSFIISTINVNMIIKSLKNLINKTKQISSGDYSIEPESKGYKECIELSNNFYIMKEKIKEREERIQALNYHDQLTGLYNRRFYEEELRRLDEEKNLPLTIVMADVNGLKLVNDSFGHSVGDELLKKVGQVINKGCRDKDIVARLSGDEFVILLPKTDIYEAEEIVKNIKELTLKEKVGAIDLSVSFGYETKNNKEEIIQEVFKKAEDYMYKKKLFESPSMRGKTINAIINTLHEKNKREEQHSHRVSELCESMGKALGLQESEIQELKTVGLLHDIGKIAINENILNKPGKLTEDEFEEIRRHPEIGYRILSTVNDLSEMAEYVLAHHERWDGRGYPKGLKAFEIPIQARIIAIADTYDAIISERSYRIALPEKIAIEELKKNSGIQFDEELVKIFIEMILEKPLE